MVMEMANSCKDCAYRHIGCHSNCATYADYKRTREQICKARALENMRDAIDIERSIKKQTNAREISRRRQGY